MEGKHSAAGIDHPRAATTPRREAEPFSVFFSWGAGELQLEPDGKQMWQGRQERDMEGSQGVDAAQVSAQGAGEMKQPLSAVGDWTARAPSLPLSSSKAPDGWGVG